MAKKESIETKATVNGEEVKAEVMNAPTVTPIDLKSQKKEFNRLCGVIKKEYGKVESSSLNIAFALHQIYKEELFRISGFNTIVEFSEENFNIAKTSTHGFISVIDKFAKKDSDGNIIYTEERGIIEQFEKFSWSKLTLLTSVPTEYLEEFDSTMTAKQIREKKVEIAKLISDNSEPKLIEDAEATTNDDITEQTDADMEESTDADTSDKEEISRKYLPICSCKTMDEFKALLENKELLLAIEMQIDRLCKDISEDKVPHIEVVFTYMN